MNYCVGFTALTVPPWWHQLSHDSPLIHFVTTSRLQLCAQLSYTGGRGVQLRGRGRSIPSADGLVDVCGKTDQNLRIPNYGSLNGLNIDIELMRTTLDTLNSQELLARPKPGVVIGSTYQKVEEAMRYRIINPVGW